jgi:hypothetical protein
MCAKQDAIFIPIKIWMMETTFRKVGGKIKGGFQALRSSKRSARKLRIGIIMYRSLQRITFQKTLKALVVSTLIILCACQNLPQVGLNQEGFDGERAYQDVIYQVSLGPRIPGEAGHDQILDWMQLELMENGWAVELQVYQYQGKEIKNLVASRGEGEHILLGAHYDTRIYADQDPDPTKRKQPVPGANDGASGVAVLLEIARTIPEDLGIALKLAFFDAEDNGGIADWEWIMGSRAYVQNMQDAPAAVIIVDMIGDADLEVYYERNSDQELMEGIWKQASVLGYEEVFISQYKHSMLDDHTPFVEEGIPAVDLIDFDYPYWHTTADTTDKVAAESLDMIGDVLYAWLLSLSK